MFEYEIKRNSKTITIFLSFEVMGWQIDYQKEGHSITETTWFDFWEGVALITAAPLIAISLGIIAHDVLTFLF